MIKTYILIAAVAISTATSCRNSNSEIIIQANEYLKNNEWALNSIIQEIENVPNLHDIGHVFIKNNNYRNQKWDLRYNVTKDKFDTVQIDKKTVQKWVNRNGVLDFEYDIVNRFSYFKVDLENKNGRFVLLVHQNDKKYNCITEISDTSQFNRLASFKYQLNESWLIFSPNDWSVTPNIMGYEGLIFYPGYE